MKELIKAIKLLLRGKLYLLPIDSQEETGIRFNTDKTITFIYPDQKYLDKAKDSTMSAVIFGFYALNCLQDVNEKHFDKWLKTSVKPKKGKNK
jgi:hypothetical protein